MLDFSQQATSYETPDTGVYELRIDNVEFKTSKNGKNYISITYVIRDDVDQPFKGSHIWDNVWENEIYKTIDGKRIKKADYDAMTESQKQNVEVSKAYNSFPFTSILHTQDLKDAKYNFENMEEVALFINQMCVQVKVTKYLDDSTDKERNSIEYKTMKPTSVKPIEIKEFVSEAKEKTSPKYEDVPDDDLPF